MFSRLHKKMTTEHILVQQQLVYKDIYIYIIYIKILMVAVLYRGLADLY